MSVELILSRIELLTEVEMYSWRRQSILQSILKGSNIRHLIHSGSHNISGVKIKRGIKTLGTV